MFLLAILRFCRKNTLSTKKSVAKNFGGFIFGGKNFGEKISVYILIRT